MRRTPLEPKRSVTAWLLMANAVAFLLECYYYGYPPRLHHPDFLALSAQGLRHGYLWQLLTFQFMHAGLWHLVMNCWVIYQFGLELEESLGPRRFLALYFFSGTLGGVVQGLMGFVVPFGQFVLPVIGASAGAFGLVAAFATLHPRQSIFTFLPIIEARHLLLFFAFLAALGMAVPKDNLANAAHLGGLLGGVLFTRGLVDWHWRLPRFGRRRAAPTRQTVRRGLAGQRAWIPSVKAAPEEDLASGDFVSREVDPILDKISAHGIHSLSDRERRILEKARARMARK